MTKLTLEDIADLRAYEREREDFRARIAGYRSGSGTFRMNVALSALPSFTALPGDGEIGRASCRERVSSPV